ncbi:serine aminopeptidase S33 family [Roseinatronobacter thiooxidans]|uniref:Serine aminopeptidase S33 family n=1 Tax=Roseinatronobacter thiooxidans TaxID=121821 RepID=A0A2W7R5Y3_9RHOB|nr:alpha/beta fold hydrolase [Roseinatronobacter thiooxidans]PZX46075.1 serine aminopeptidase S33 family [Roseinatronobacter thiooxidans]
MPRLIALLSLLIIGLSIWQLEGDRAGLTITPVTVEGGTPATLYLRNGAGAAPVVVIAHGFAGSRQLMDPFALTLAEAGYVVASFDFEGHGRNPRPMSGDVTTIDGTTRLLMDETARVARAALAHPRADGRLVYLGHSMASDIIVRQALEAPRADAVVAISMFSEAVTADAPRNLLVIAGEWEAMLAEEALRALRLTDPQARAGDSVGDPAQGTGRRAVIAPKVEHVGVLYSATALHAARDWLDASFGRDSSGPVAQRGGWIAALLLATVALAWPLARALPAGAGPVPPPLSAKRVLVAALAPALLVPLALAPFEIRVLPVLVADYLVLHLGLYGLMTLALLWHWGQFQGQFPARIWWVGAAVALFGIAVLGGVIDRYVASFLPHSGRMVIIAGLALGAVPFLLADGILTQGGKARLWRVVLARVAFLASLGLAVALNFEALFFLLIILPVIVLFFLLFGTMSGWVGRRTGLPAAGGLGLGLVLAWALGVTFPMFDAGAF